jgi:cyanate lyase
MRRARGIADWMKERGVSVADLEVATGFDRRVVEAIVVGRYTTSPEHRRILAAALGVTVDDIAWDYVIPVSHVYGHGPQFGRSP